MDVLESFELRWFFAHGDAGVAELNDWFREVPVENDARRAGEPERWVKVSLDLPSVALSSDVRCVEIQKRRRLRKFAFEAGGCVEVSAQDRPQAGCGVEFTEITLMRAGSTKRAYSFGLEAFGPPPISFDGLQNTMRLLAQERPDLRLSSGQASNYSDWLIQEFAGEV